MIKVAICDDVKMMRQEVKKHLLAYGQKHKNEYCLYEYESGTKLLEDEKEYDLIILDYQYDNDKENDGITVARRIRQKYKYVPIIFLSAYPSVVFDSFEVGTFRFLTKPIDNDKFTEAMDAFGDVIKKDSILTVKVQGTNRYLHTEEISYIEAIGKYSKIHIFTGEELECRETLAMLEERVPKSRFFRSHKSFLVNLAYVDSFSHMTITLTTKEEVFLSRAKYKEFDNIFMEYVLSR